MPTLRIKTAPDGRKYVMQGKKRFYIASSKEKLKSYPPDLLLSFLSELRKDIKKIPKAPRGRAGAQPRSITATAELLKQKEAIRAKEEELKKVQDALKASEERVRLEQEKASAELEKADEELAKLEEKYSDLRKLSRITDKAKIKKLLVDDGFIKPTDKSTLKELKDIYEREYLDPLREDSSTSGTEARTAIKGIRERTDAEKEQIREARAKREESRLLKEARNRQALKEKRREERELRKQEPVINISSEESSASEPGAPYGTPVSTASEQSDSSIDKNYTKERQAMEEPSSDSGAGLPRIEELEMLQGGGSEPGMGDALLGSEIEAVAQNIPGFVGLCFMDKIAETLIPHLEDEQASIIFNTLLSTGESNELADGANMAHYCAITLDNSNSKVLTYDPLAEDLPEEVMKQLTLLLENTPELYKLKVNTVKHQNRDETNCGFHTLAYLQRIADGDDYATATLFNKIDGQEEAHNKFLELKKKIDFKEI